MTEIVCSYCGSSFDPSGAATCQGCPLQKGCQLVRCPQCGFEMVDPRRSRLARLAGRLLHLDQPGNPAPQEKTTC